MHPWLLLGGIVAVLLLFGALHLAARRHDPGFDDGGRLPETSDAALSELHRATHPDA